jgi:hypothetical protein
MPNEGEELLLHLTEGGVYGIDLLINDVCGWLRCEFAWTPGRAFGGGSDRSCWSALGIV